MKDLIKQLRNTPSRSKRELLDKAADAIEQLEQKLNALNSVTVQEWIPVKERLPTREDANETESIIAIHKDYGYASKWIWDIVARYPTEFTHWMPLPEPLSDGMIEILNQLHTERLDYTSEYLPLIDGANRLADYEATGLNPEETAVIIKAFEQLCKEPPFVDPEKWGHAAAAASVAEIRRLIKEVYGVSEERLFELLAAEKDGRLVIIPEPSAGLECDLLEPMKVGYALKSEVVKLNMRLSRDPKSVNRLDYTIIAALQAVLEGGESNG